MNRGAQLFPERAEAAAARGAVRRTIGRHGRSLAHTLAVALALLVFATPAARATTFLERTPEELALAADLIFVGTVSAVDVSLEAGTPWTSVTFAIEDLVLDRADDSDDQQDEDGRREVTLEFLGGATAGGERLTVSGLPNYEEGQRVLVFAYDQEGLASPIVGVRQGSWTLGVQGARGEDGTYLAVPAPGRLQRGAVGAGPAEVVESIVALLDAGTLPEEPAPGEDEGDGAPADTPPGDEAPADAPEEEPMDEAPAEDVPADEPARDRPPTDEPPAEEPPAEQPPVEEPPAEQPPAGEPPVEEPPAGEPPVEAPPADEQPVEAPPAEEQPVETPAAEENPAEAPPAATAPTSEPAPPIVVRYRVDESGGPLLLSTAVNQAAAAWSEAAPDAVDFVQQTDDGGTAPLDGHLVRYGDAALFGPDALSLTLARGDANATEVLVSPTAGSLLGPVLLHELGVLLGLAEGGAGVMSFSAVPGVAAPTPADVAALRELRTFRAEDLNRDGVVDFYDLAALGQAFGRSGVNLVADLNGDGQVDEADLAILEAAYQFLPPNEQLPAPPGL